jgi:hypothetical protein
VSYLKRTPSLSEISETDSSPVSSPQSESCPATFCCSFAADSYAYNQHIYRWMHYRNDNVLSFNEFIKSLAQIWLHVTPQTTKSESMAFRSSLRRRSVISSFGRTKWYMTIHCVKILNLFRIDPVEWRCWGGDGGRWDWFCVAWMTSMWRMICVIAFTR